MFDRGLPHGAVVGGPAPRRQIKSQGFDVRGPLNTRFAAYEDLIGDYVTAEPALDYSAASGSCSRRCARAADAEDSPVRRRLLASLRGGERVGRVRRPSPG